MALKTIRGSFYGKSGRFSALFLQTAYIIRKNRVNYFSQALSQAPISCLLMCIIHPCINIMLGILL